MEEYPWDIHENTTAEGDLPNVSKGSPQCKKVAVSNGKQYYVHVKSPRLDDIGQLDIIGNIVERPDTNGIYNYIIYKNKDGVPSMLFAKHVFPNELASKHFYLLLYAMNKGLTTTMTPLLAGELKKDGSNYKINFQSGTYTRDYKYEFERHTAMDDVEEKWFDKLKNMLKEAIGTDELFYVSNSFFDTDIIEFDKDAFLKLQGLGKEISFFEDENICKSIDVLRMNEKGLPISSFMFRSNKNVLDRDPETKKITVKPEYASINLIDHVISLEQIIAQSGGRRRVKTVKKRRKHRKKTQKIKRK